ncbi:MAG: hypothetical protein ABIN91_21270 [Mucilaginibacter sp.]|uniref:hypothetical protein n=1 Tax=Mucilaginibacter sp. TaxID=1882438 RepID=UPI00326324B8
MKRTYIILVALLAIIASAAFIQNDDVIDVLGKKLIVYQLEHPATVLHLHLDKNIYNTNEDIWFKAYILNPEPDSSKVLYVRITDMNKKVVLKDQFPITDIRSNGDIMIPDTLREGNYYLYAYTDRMISYTAKNIFVQRITIKHNSAKKLYAEASVIDTSQLKRGHTVQVLVRVKNDHDLLKNIKGEYTLITGDGPARTGKLSTNQFGEATITFVYPSLPDNKSLSLKVSFKNNADFADLLLNLKHEGNPIQVNLYPEGGHYIDGVPVKTVVRVTDIKSNPVAAKITIKNGQKIIADLQLNKSGFGIFNFKPIANAVYTVDAETEGNKSTIPFNGVIQPKGYILKVVEQNSQLNATLKNFGDKEHVKLVLRSLTNILWSQSITVPSGDSVVIHIPVSGYPKQVLNIGAFDDAGNLLSERLLLNKQNENYHVDIKTDMQIYGPRKKVTVYVNITDAFGKPVMANLSIAAAEKDRTDQVDNHDILNTWYFRFLDGDNYSNTLYDKNLDIQMITQNWRQSRWDDVLKYTERGKIIRLKNTDGEVGFLNPFKKGAAKISQLIVMSKSRSFAVEVDKNNYFSIPSANLIRDRGEKRYLLLSNEQMKDYEITLMNYPREFDEKVVVSGALFIPEVFNTLAQYQETKQKTVKGVLQLKEVKIKGNTWLTDFQSTDCNDMVCMYNILNCINHPGCCTTPIDGGVYLYRRGEKVIYHSCNDFISKSHPMLKCISIAKQFYLPDYDKKPSADFELHSTIYWNPNLNTDAQGNASFSFYTSDITGNFLINAQGIDVRTILPVSGLGNFQVQVK